MAKNIASEIVFHHILRACNQIRQEEGMKSDRVKNQWNRLLKSFKIVEKSNGLYIHWFWKKRYFLRIPIEKLRLYVRGDEHTSITVQRQTGSLLSEDKIRKMNEKILYAIAVDILIRSNFIQPLMNGKKRKMKAYSERFISEEEFHDSWADSIKAAEVDVVAVNEIITSPEMRYIHSILGNVKHKKILDVGCGLGEVGIYFAKNGADVTLMDISQGMLNKANEIAKLNHVSVKRYNATLENLTFPGNPQFDIIYVGNLFHHVNIDCAIRQLLPYLKLNGQMISRDPLAYNPIINIYRAVATEVRSKDEHPLKREDIQTFSKYFGKVQTKYFWLTTLIIFVIMALVQWRNPNRERYWKKIEEEGNKWSWIYTPLEKLDSFLLTFFSPLRYMCWNVVIHCTKKRMRIYKI